MWGTERRVFILIFKVVALKLGVLLGVWWPEWGKERGGLAQTETEGGGHGVVWPQSGGGAQQGERVPKPQLLGVEGWGRREGMARGWRAGGRSLGRGLRACGRRA